MKETGKRYLFDIIEKTLNKKMVFIGGPRQVGKTTLSLEYLAPSTPQNESYLNYDDLSDRKKILKNELPLSKAFIVLDEIHKYKKWRSLLKGLFDKYHNITKILVTGSARLDYFRKGGDSLLGRYRYFRLHPLSLFEISKEPSKKDLSDLLLYGGFPEPFFSKNEDELRIWQNERMKKVIMEDLRDLQNVKEVSLLLLLAETLPSRVGSPLSLNNLSLDLDVSSVTLKNWVNLLSNLYYIFMISPYGAPKIRAVKKLQKSYMWDWSQVQDKGAKFENLVASQLLKYCHFIEDTKGHVMELRYLRDTDGREVDFVVLQDKEPIFAVECKTGDKSLSPHIKYFRERTPIPKYYQVHQGEKDFGLDQEGRVLPFITFCKELKMP